MKVHDVDGFPNPARIRLALAVKNALDQVTFVPVDVMAGEHRSAAFRAKNPDASVPCLELSDGTVLSQCTAITEYIDQHFDGPALCGRTALERGTIHMMNRRAEHGLLDAVGDYFHHATPGLGPDLETNQNADWGNRRKQTALDTMRYLDGILQSQSYLAGSSLSMADLTAYAGLAFADFAGVPIDESLTSLRNWRDKLTAREDFGRLAAA